MSRSKSGAAPRWMNAVSIIILIAGVFLVFARLGPERYRRSLNNLMIYAWGDSVGCDLAQVLSPADERIKEIGLRIGESLKRIEEADGLVHWGSSVGDYWSPASNLILVLLAEQELDGYQAGPIQVQRGDVVLDCGANVGTFSRLALDAGAAHVVAIEPSPLNVKALHKNFAAEIAEGRFAVVPKALWHEPGTMMLKLYQYSLLDSLVMEGRSEGEGVSEVEVELITIDQLTADLKLPSVDFIKMDIEGAERNALNGAAETLRRFRPRMAIAAENLPDDIHAVPAAINYAVPGYEFSSGSCREIQSGVVRPEILFFSPG